MKVRLHETLTENRLCCMQSGASRAVSKSQGAGNSTKWRARNKLELGASAKYKLLRTSSQSDRKQRNS